RCGVLYGALMAAPWGVPLAVERGLEDLLHGIHDDELEPLAGLVRQVLEVGLVLAGNDHTLQAGALGRERLLADASNREHLARERDLAGHADVGHYGLVEDQRGDRGRHR